MIVYAFDVDETLEVSGGPIELNDLVELAICGAHINGICGNWAILCASWPKWYKRISFLGPAHDGFTKPEFLGQIKRYVSADDYVLVGNDHSKRAFASPDDKRAADEAGWRFISEADFAKGAR